MDIKRLIRENEALPRFLLVGCVNTLVGAGTMFLLYNLAGCSYWFSSAMNIVAGGTVSFLLNRSFTFRSRGGVWWRQLLRFAVCSGVCWLAAYGIAKPLVLRLLHGQNEAVQTNLAMFAGMCLYTLLNYLLQKYIVFAKQKKESVENGSEPR